MRKTILCLGALALAACNGADAPDDAATDDAAGADSILEGDAPGFEAVAPGDYTVEHANGDIDNITIHPGMTYSRVAADGSATGGTIFMQDGKTCFVVEGVEGHNCFLDGPVQEDGSMETTSDNGDVSTVRPVVAE
ncbi:MAG: hypothetical protein GWN87_29000 [Desulfuromonadales bacterium]|nr:hypothetical protein [Desulfuromonadales bacterium]